MKKENDNIDTLLDRAIDLVSTDQPTEAEESASAERVWAALEQASAGGVVADPVASVMASETAPLETLDDFVALIPDYLEGRLPEAKSLLLLEESRRSIPLRRALDEARRRINSPDVETESESSAQSPAWIRWAAAAVVAAAAGLSVFLFAPDLIPMPQGNVAQVHELDGQLFLVGEHGLESLEVGAWINGRDEIRSSKGTSAVLRLDDDSLVELDERSSLKMRRSIRGDRVRVDRGRVVVEASPQGSGRLKVSTDEFQIAVKGTIFGVSHGTKGSRVSVVEGEVEVRHGGQRHSLTVGQQLGTRQTLSLGGVEDDISWSHGADRYIAMLKEMNELQQDINRLMTSEPRYSTRLLDMAPADATVYVAMPNATAKLADAYDMIRERLSQDEAFAEAWAAYEDSDESDTIDTFFQRLRALSDYLGDETVVTLAGSSENPVPVVLSEVTDPAALAATLEDQIADFKAEIAARVETSEDGAEANVDSDFDVRVISDLSEAVNGQLSIWIGDDLLIASTSVAAMQQVDAVANGADNPFIGSEFHTRLSESYLEGTQFLAAVDIAQLLGEEFAGPEVMAIGLANARYLLLERRQNGDTAETAAELQFDGDRYGVMSWLAEPGPLASLEFFSPDATFVSASVIRDPEDLFTEIMGMLSMSGEDTSEPLQTFYEETGLDLQTDLLAPLGGEFAAGIDGPALPVPSWKVVVEVYDEFRLQQSFEILVDNANARASEAGVDYSVDLVETSANGRTFYTLSGTAPEDSTVLPGMMEAHYTFVDGFLVMGPSRALIERAISYYESGANLPSSEDFRALLPQDDYIDFSAVGYNRLGDLLGEVMDRIPQAATLSAEQQQELDELRSATGPSLYCLYGERDRIRFVMHGSGSLPLAGIGQLKNLVPVVDNISSTTPIGQVLRGGRFDEYDTTQNGGITWQ